MTRSVGALYELTCVTEATKSYTVQFTDTLTNLNWQPLTNFVASGATAVVTDSNGAPQRYYRLVAH